MLVPKQQRAEVVPIRKTADDFVREDLLAMLDEIRAEVVDGRVRTIVLCRHRSDGTYRATGAWHDAVDALGMLRLCENAILESVE